MLIKHNSTGYHLKWCQVTAVLCDHWMALHLKSKIYRTVVYPVSLSGSEYWLVTAKHKQAVHTIEMLMVWWCLGLTWFDHAMNDNTWSRELEVLHFPIVQCILFIKVVQKVAIPYYDWKHDWNGSKKISIMFGAVNAPSSSLPCLFINLFYYFYIYIS